MKVKVHKNLNKGCWSVKEKGKPMQHFQDLVLVDATFHIQPSGQRKARRDKVRNVHAYVSGTMIPNVPKGPFKEVVYNPFKNDTFVTTQTYFADPDPIPVKSAEVAYFTPYGVLLTVNPKSF